MKKWKIGIIILAGIILLTSWNQKSILQPRQKILFDFDWKFHRGDIESGQNIMLNDDLWRKLDLPHDWSIEDLPDTNSPFDSMAISSIDGGYLIGGTSWYRKKFNVPKEYSDKKLSLYFEGIYMNSDIWLNGLHLGNHPYGYTAFEFDISKIAKIGGENVLAVQVKNEGRNSRWYSGSGIYRHVWMKVTEPVHIKTWGTFITTPAVSAINATVKIVNEIANETEENHTIQVAIQVMDKNGNIVGTSKSSELVEANSEISDVQSIQIEAPELWSIETPDLYKALIKIQNEKGILLDLVEEHFGVRKLEFSVENGFLLNGQPTLLKGGCMHHGNGPLGAAAYDRAEERRVELMKASGFNAIRCAHNPPSEAFLAACDRLGMLVIDETFDMWQRPKNPQDYSVYFDEWWQRDVDAMVLRDRNHPSIIMWSIGNEIPERGEPEGFQTAKMLVDYIRKIDSTRPVTSAVNGLGPDKDPYFATLDISGYNYSSGGDHGQKSIFETDHQRVPNRIMYCSESYPFEAFGAWKDAEKYPYVLGDFVWTGFDYLGEASIGWRGYPHDENFYPWNHAFCGDIDICGFRRPQSFYRDLLWGGADQLSVFVTPPVPSFPVKENRADWSKWHWHDHVAEWNWAGYEGQPIDVNVYSGYEKVELFLNGKSLGVKRKTSFNQLIATWQVPYQPGKIKVVAYEDEKEVAHAYLKTAEKPVKIELKPESLEIKATGQDLCYVVVDLVDENGLRNPATDDLVQFEIEGAGEIIAVASSNPMSVESFQQHQRKSYKGRCLVIIKSGKNSGTIRLIAKTDSLGFAETEINVKNE